MHISNLYQSCILKTSSLYMSLIKFDICMLNSQILLPLFVNHQQRGKQSKQNKIFSPFLFETMNQQRG